jgi:hypothetical protein
MAGWMMTCTPGSVQLGWCAWAPPREARPPLPPRRLLALLASRGAGAGHTSALPGKSRYSRLLGIMVPVPMSVIGITGTLALTATEKAPCTRVAAR